MHDLVVGALKERRIDRGKGTHALSGQTGGEGHRVLFRDADIERAVGMRLGELVDTGSARHGSGDGADTRVLFR